LAKFQPASVEKDLKSDEKNLNTSGIKLDEINKTPLIEKKASFKQSLAKFETTNVEKDLKIDEKNLNTFGIKLKKTPQIEIEKKEEGGGIMGEMLVSINKKKELAKQNAPKDIKQNNPLLVIKEQEKKVEQKNPPLIIKREKVEEKKIINPPVIESKKDKRERLLQKIRELKNAQEENKLSESLQKQTIPLIIKQEQKTEEKKVEEKKIIINPPVIESKKDKRERLLQKLELLDPQKNTQEENEPSESLKKKNIQSENLNENLIDDEPPTPPPNDLDIGKKIFKIETQTKKPIDVNTSGTKNKIENTGGIITQPTDLLRDIRKGMMLKTTISVHDQKLLSYPMSQQIARAFLAPDQPEKKKLIDNLFEDLMENESVNKNEKLANELNELKKTISKDVGIDEGSSNIGVEGMIKKAMGVRRKDFSDSESDLESDVSDSEEIENKKIEKFESPKKEDVDTVTFYRGMDPKIKSLKTNVIKLVEFAQKHKIDI
jgi:hypothetical protein